MNRAARFIGQMPVAQRVEFEQAILRVAIPTFVLVGFAGYWLLGGELSQNRRHALWFTIGYLLFAVALVLWILAERNVSPKRRYTVIVAGNAFNSYFMLVSGEVGAAVFAVYLFVTFGNGFRYGRSYLRASQALSLLGFAVVCYYSDFWRQHGWLSTGVLIAMVVLPSYVAFLLTQLQTALRQAQQQVRELSQRLAELTPPSA